MDIKEFKKSIKNVTGKRNTVITNSYGNNDAWKYYNKAADGKPELTSTQYRALINKVNDLLANELLTIGTIQFPVGLGNLSIYSKDRKPRIKNGKLEYNAPIDWNRTLELWATDPESKVAKTVIKMPPGTTFSFKYKTRYRSFKNRRYMKFVPTRTIKQALKNKILNKESLAHIKQYNG